jgi:hypothetical protein
MGNVINVPRGLEYFSARKLQVSGLVLSAHPMFSPNKLLAPPFQVFEQSNRVLAEILRGSLSNDDKLQKLTRLFDGWLYGFLHAKRPTFVGHWETARRNGGSPLIYRTQVVGPTVSRCQKTGWEMFDLQIIPTSIDETRSTIMMQVVEGYEAPGALKRRPPDGRFKDNPLNDAQLARIQEAVAAFFGRHGFIQEESPENDEAQRNEACSL